MLKNLKALRQENDLTQQMLSDKMGVSQQSINAYENSNVEPDIAMLVKLADLFEVSVDYLIDHTDIRHKYEELFEYGLNNAESHLVDVYRKLPPEIRGKFVDLMDEFLRSFQN